MMVLTSRKKYMADHVVFVDGQAGCGKTLISKVVSSLDRVELMNYTYEIEYFCALRFLDKLSSDGAQTLIRLMTDLRLYNLMQSREINFRPTDLSSVFKDHNPGRYFQRLMQPGDEAIPGIVEREKPILHLTTHQTLGFSEPIWQALGGRCVFIEVVRHPLYMVRQQELNMIRLLGDVRDFLLNIEYKDQDIPFYVHGWEECFINSTPMEQTVYSIDRLAKRSEVVKKEMKEKYGATIVTIPFEPFVLDPEPWVKLIADAMGSKAIAATRKTLSEQNVPREKVAQGIDLDIYKRCGWTPPVNGADEREELKIRREDVARTSSDDVMKIVDRISDEYEKEYWKPD
jgi:hypothetical protein